jgi:hypothetical protein
MTQYLYLLECQKYFKIGIANDVQSRLAQLSTGNPFELNVAAVYEFQNAEPVERAIHQRFQSLRKRGEWFSLGEREVSLFNNICSLLGGEVSEQDPTVNECEIQEAEEVQEATLDRHTNGDGWDYAAMFADGWRLNVQDSRRLYWNWRRGSDENRQTIYGGVVADLPYSIEDMRRIYRDGLEPLLEGVNHE